MYLPFWRQEDPWLGNWTNCWPVSHNPQSKDTTSDQEPGSEVWRHKSHRIPSGSRTLVVPLTLFLMVIYTDYPRTDDIDRPLNEATADKIRDYRADYNNRPFNSISFMTAVASTWPPPLWPCANFILQVHGKPTFLLFQEFSLTKQIRTSSITVARRSTPSSNLKSGTSSSWLQHGCNTVLQPWRGCSRL